MSRRAMIIVDHMTNDFVRPEKELTRDYATALVLALSVIIFLVACSFPKTIRAEENFGVVPVRRQTFLLVTDQRQEASRKNTLNLRLAMQYASLSFDEISGQEFTGAAWKSAPHPHYDAVILAAESAGQLLSVQETISFVRTGGLLFVALRTWNPELWETIGLRPTYGSSPEFIDGTGVQSCLPIFQKEDAVLGTKQFGASGYHITPSASWTIQIRYQNPATMPLLLERSFGEGRIVFWNADCLHQKEFRGLFLFSLLRSLPFAAMTVFNTILMEIDDSPPPAYGGKTGVVGNEMGLTDFQFYESIWYEQVPPFLREAGLKLVHFPCFCYTNQMTGSFTAITDREEFFESILERIRKSGDEIGFHGYNHQSLYLASGPYPPWPSGESMISALSAGVTLWEKFELSPPLSYAPPNNLIDQDGKRALSLAFPSMRNICRLYIGLEDFSSASSTPMLIGDEFGFDKDIPKLMNIPRLSNGYFLDEVTKFSILNGVMTHGMVNHFVHPDDIFDENRGLGKNWEAIFSSLQHMIRYFISLLPVAQKMTPSEFMVPLKKYLEEMSGISIGKDRTLLIQGNKRPYLFVFSQQIASAPTIIGGHIICTIEPGKLYLMEMSDASASIHFH
ncbi:MAG: DUF2194 domain-containing protein [Candidatus Riflebacteria bacterium]|nr:DUF2194 domain-containing protein [Candidatus Riflebacteria bacterium]